MHKAKTDEARRVILFVTQSATRGGVVTVLGHILSNWPGTDRRLLILAYNKAHGGAAHFNAIAAGDGRIDTVEVPVWDHMAALSRPENQVLWKRYALKLLHRLIQPLLFAQAVYYFWELCRDRKVSVVFSHNGGFPGGMLNRAAIVGARLAMTEKIYLIVHNLAVRPRKVARMVAWLHDTMLSHLMTGLITVSEASADALRTNRFITKNISVIYNGIPILSKNPPFERKRPYDKFVAAYVGELSDRKGVVVLLRSIAAIQDPVILLLYGRGEPEYEQELRAQSRALGIAEKVQFMGFDPDVAEKLADADVLVLPSIAYESFGMVILEAMKQKKPAIVTEVGGMKEVVVDGETGFVVPANDPEALSSALLGLIRNPARAVSLGENGYQRLCEKFSAERMIADYYLIT